MALDGDVRDREDGLVGGEAIQGGVALESFRAFRV